MPKKILIIDDERSIRKTLTEILSFEGYKIDAAVDGKEGIEKLFEQSYDCILCDIKMPTVDGLEVFEKAKSTCPEVPFIFISGHGTIETAVEAVKNGAFDFISKPPDLNHLLITLRNALEKESLVKEAQKLKKRIIFDEEIIGNSEAIKNILALVAKVAPTDARVLITGANGSGKELIAKRLHRLSKRSQHSLIEVNCAAIPSELIESELFGHERGAFTSAIKQRIGKFEQADEGSLFLDEIGDMSLSAQSKVLRVLQEGKITRVGGEKEINVNVRIIAATNKDLQKAIEQGQFREDLYHRLSVIKIYIPSLNERVDDIKELSTYFLKTICSEYNMPLKEIEKKAVEKMQQHEWKGNIRELRNVIERLIILCDKKITEKDVEEYVFLN